MQVLSNKEKNKNSLIRKLKAKTNELKENIKLQKRKNTPFKILLCAVQNGIGKSVAQYLNEEKSYTQIMMFGQDYSRSIMEGVLGINILKEDIVFALLDSRNAYSIFGNLCDKFDLNASTPHAFACLMPPSSATFETIKLLVRDYKKPIQL